MFELSLVDVDLLVDYLFLCFLFFFCGVVFVCFVDGVGYKIDNEEVSIVVSWRED